MLSAGSKYYLGCSHIYNSNGLGLRYRLSKIDNPIIRHHNPFLSYSMTHIELGR